MVQWRSVAPSDRVWNKEDVPASQYLKRGPQKNAWSHKIASANTRKLEGASDVREQVVGKPSICASWFEEEDRGEKEDIDSGE